MIQSKQKIDLASHQYLDFVQTDWEVQSLYFMAIVLPDVRCEVLYYREQCSTVLYRTKNWAHGGNNDTDSLLTEDGCLI